MDKLVVTVTGGTEMQRKLVAAGIGDLVAERGGMGHINVLYDEKLVDEIQSMEIADAMAEYHPHFEAIESIEFVPEGV